MRDRASEITLRAGAGGRQGERIVVDPTLTALSAVFFLSSMSLFAYGFRERRREHARAQHVIDLREPAAAPATARARQRA